MKNLALLLASVMPEDVLIDMIEKDIAAYKLNPSKETRSKLGFTCMLFAGKDAAESIPGGVEEMMKRSDRMEQGMELLNPKKN